MHMGAAFSTASRWFTRLATWLSHSVRGNLTAHRAWLAVAIALVGSAGLAPGGRRGWGAAMVAASVLPYLVPLYGPAQWEAVVKAGGRHGLTALEARPSKIAALVSVGLGIAALVLGAVTSWSHSAAFDPHRAIADVELAGTRPGHCLARLAGPDLRIACGDVTVGLGDALRWDLVFIAGYALFLWVGTTAATWMFWTRRSAATARFARGLVPVVALADLAENALLAVGFGRAAPGAPPVDPRHLLDAAAVLSRLKFALLLPAAAVAVAGTWLVIQRVATSVVANARVRPGGPWDWSAADHVRLPDGVIPDQTTVPPSDAERRPLAFDERWSVDLFSHARHRPADGAVDPAEHRWIQAYRVPSVEERHRPDDPVPPGAVGFCLSGGGIRSASFCLGFLQTLRSRLLSADYLVSVSGGGYTSGALSMALAPGPPGDLYPGAHLDVVRDPATAFQPGSVELDHLRRHASYIAASAVEMVVALAVVARSLVASVFVLFAPAAVLGIVAGYGYLTVPLALLPAPGRPTTTLAGVTSTLPSAAGLQIGELQWIAVGVVAVVAGALWLLQLAVRDPGGGPVRSLYVWAATTATATTQALVVVALVLLGIPAVVAAAGWALSSLHVTVPTALAGTSVGSVILSYLGALAALLWKKRSEITALVGGNDGTTRTAVKAAPNGAVQLLLVIVGVVVLGASWLVLFGVAAAGTIEGYVAAATASPPAAAPSSVTVLGLQPLPLAGVLIGVLFVLGLVMDESSLSLHPFYRRRLARAFAVRRVRLRRTASTGTAVDGDAPPAASAPFALPYVPLEATALDTYTQPVDAAASPLRYPEVVFAAAASLTGEHRTAAGSTAVSYTFSRDWCGGPDVGWVRTTTLRTICSNRLRRDLTVQGAVAISGAAIASAMGRQSRWYQILLAVTGARLGAWLPNPAFVAQLRQARDDHGRTTDWTRPHLPRVRRAPYLVREVLNVHPAGEKLLQVTDGGHYENLGLVELLRRRCRTIYCADGGGDSPPTLRGLAEAIALAHTELGVTFVIDDEWSAEPGSGAPIDPKDPLSALNAALSKEPVVTATFRYPAASGLPATDRTGRLFLGKALTWPQMPYTLLSHTAAHPVFPRDSTSDQWFDDDQFTAYCGLGRAVGQLVAHRAAKEGL